MDVGVEYGINRNLNPTLLFGFYTNQRRIFNRFAAMRISHKRTGLRTDRQTSCSRINRRWPYAFSVSPKQLNSWCERAYFKSAISKSDISALRWPVNDQFSHFRALVIRFSAATSTLGFLFRVGFSISLYSYLRKGHTAPYAVIA